MSGSIAISGIGQLVTNDPELGQGSLGVISDVSVVVENGVIVVRRRIEDRARRRRRDPRGRAMCPSRIRRLSHPSRLRGGPV